MADPDRLRLQNNRLYTINNDNFHHTYKLLWFSIHWFFTIGCPEFLFRPWFLRLEKKSESPESPEPERPEIREIQCIQCSRPAWPGVQPRVPAQTSGNPCDPLVSGLVARYDKPVIEICVGVISCSQILNESCCFNVGCGEIPYDVLTWDGCLSMLPAATGRSGFRKGPAESACTPECPTTKDFS